VAQIFGDFIEPSSQDQEYLKLGFSPTSIPLQQRWRNNGLSADFLADYLTTFFPSDDAEAQDRQAEIKSAVSYIANELLENAMKFSYAPARHAVSITMNLDQDNIRFYTTNCIDPASCEPFQTFVAELLAGDPQELYMERLEANAEGAEGGSGLGFLTMINDYNARLAWQFVYADNEPDVVLVTAMVQLSV
jgi:hypothetical protein